MKVRRYSKVYRRVWNDEKFRRLSSAPPNAQTLWLRLLTGPELSNIPGLIVMGEASMAEALRWPLEGFRKAFAEVSREGMAEADWDARLVWVPKAISHNDPESPNVVLSWEIPWDETPECALKSKAFSSIRAHLEAKGKAWVEAFDQACSKPSPRPSRNQEQEQEQEKEQEGESAPKVAPPPKASKPKRLDGHAAAMACPEVCAVVDFYRTTHRVTDAWKPSSKEGRYTRAEHIHRALNGEGGDQLTADEIRQAIAGNAHDPWHREKHKHEISYVLRSDKVRGFIGSAPKAAAASSASEVSNLYRLLNESHNRAEQAQLRYDYDEKAKHDAVSDDIRKQIRALKEQQQVTA